MKPHLWLSALSEKAGQWACCTARTTRRGMIYGRVRTPVGEIFYGTTPTDAYNNWKEYHVGRT